jgi:D-sedoheptulose 7-phosphate isomerase
VSNEIFIHNYLSECEKAVRALPADAIEDAATVMLDAYHRGATVFVVGNGGSASLASHLACDLAKNATQNAGDVPRFKVMPLADNLAMLTAYANDVSYEAVFAEPLKTYASSGDVLVVISASGNSPNVVRALEAAEQIGMSTIAWTGFSGGRCRELADYVVHVPVDDYGVVESVHGVVAHLVTAWITQAIGNQVTAGLARASGGF